MGVETLLNLEPPFEEIKEKRKPRTEQVERKSFGPDGLAMRLTKCLDIHRIELENLKSFYLAKQKLDHIKEKLSDIRGTSLMDTRDLEKELHLAERKIKFYKKTAERHKRVINKEGEFFLEKPLFI